MLRLRSGNLMYHGRQKVRLRVYQKLNHKYIRLVTLHHFLIYKPRFQHKTKGAMAERVDALVLK